MKRALLPAAACAIAALAVAACSPPVEQSEFNNSGLSAKVAFDPSAVPAAPANPPPRIEPAPGASTSQASGGETQPPAAKG
jgi:hypothetical protein